MKYRHLLFDLDDTLLDFSAAERSALRSTLEAHGLPFNQATEAAYQRINRALWNAFEAGAVSREEVLHTRHARLFAEFGLVVDGRDLDEAYRTYLEAEHQFIEGARELLEALHPTYDLYIVTNGVSRTQDRRLRGSGLHPLFKGVFVSEDTGYQKPMKQYFDHVFARIPGFRVDEALIVGDSLTADMAGGQLAGLDTCWFNPAAHPNRSAVVPTYEIRRLDQLHRVLAAVAMPAPAHEQVHSAIEPLRS